MARVIGGLGTSHVPTIGIAFDKGKQSDRDWSPLFNGYEPRRRRSGEAGRYPGRRVFERDSDGAFGEEREKKEATNRERLRNGELGLDLYDMREALAEKGLRYVDRPARLRCC